MSADAEIAELALLPPEEFVAARDDLARRRKAGGDRAGAAEVRRLRRPSLAAWLAVQVRAQHPASVAALRATSAEVARTQAAAITAGDRDALRRATAARRSALADLSRSVDQVLEATGRPAHHRDGVVASLAAEITAEVASGGLGLPDDFEPAGADEPAGTRAEAPAPENEDRARAARAARAAADQAVAEASAQVSQARRALDRAAQDLAAAEQALATAEQERRHLDR
ncbi:MAG TPA: hypothetical protein VNT56_11490 [Acidimicrobiales bacterium]|nr:hypothetical protein [Acidimicrobiales bacterium]